MTNIKSLTVIQLFFGFKKKNKTDEKCSLDTSEEVKCTVALNNSNQCNSALFQARKHVPAKFVQAGEICPKLFKIGEIRPSLASSKSKFTPMTLTGVGALART